MARTGEAGDLIRREGLLMPDGEMHGLRVALLVAHGGIGQVVLTGPWDAVERVGGRTISRPSVTTWRR